MDKLQLRVPNQHKWAQDDIGRANAGICIIDMKIEI